MMQNHHSKNLGYWIKQYSRLANQAMDKELKPYGIGRAQWYVLYHVQASGSLLQRTLQKFLHIESATLTSLISALVRKGLIVQRTDLHDKRSKTLSLTPAGLALWQRLPDPIETVKVKSLRHIALEDIEKARDVLERAVGNLEEEKEHV